MQGVNSTRQQHNGFRHLRVTALLLCAFAGSVGPASAWAVTDLAHDARSAGYVSLENLQWAPAQGENTAVGAAHSVADVFDDKFFRRFKAYGGQQFDSGDIWFKTELTHLDASGPRYLKLGDPRLLASEIWVRAGQRWQRLSAEGPAAGLGVHTGSFPNVTVKLPETPGTATLLVRQTSTVPFVGTLELYDSLSFRAATRMALFGGGAGFGALLILTVYAFFIAALTRDRLYGLLGAHCLAMLIFLFHYMGYSRPIMWGDLVALDYTVTVSAPFFVFASYLVFCRSFLGFTANIWYRIPLYCSMLAGGLFMAGLQAPQLYTAATALGGVACCAMTVVSLIMGLRGNRRGWHYLIANSFSFIGGTASILDAVFGLGHPGIGNVLMLVGTDLTVFCLVMILAGHIRVLQRQNKDANLREEAARQAAQNAHAVAAQKSAFLATMSHEIRTPMNGVLGMSELLAATRLDAEQSSYVDAIGRSGTTLMAILDDILDYSKFESGNFNFEQVEVDLVQLIDDVSLSAREQVQHKSVAIQADLAPGVPRWVCSDPTRLRQIISNLVNNAIKFTEQGYIRLQVCPAENGVEFIITDTGIGMDQQELASLFERFKQADSSITRKYGGSGLGLSICKLLTEAMGGSITVNTRKGLGSTFTVRLPLAEAQQPVQQRQASGNTATDTPLSGCNILVAEDNSTNQLVVRKLLTQAGAAVTVVENGQQAVQAAAQQAFDVVLMDCEMPVMDGYTATREIRAAEADGRRTPIIAATAHVTSEYRNLAREAGMDGYIAKPLRRDKLLNTLKQLVLDSPQH